MTNKNRFGIASTVLGIALLLLFAIAYVFKYDFDVSILILLTLVFSSLATILGIKGIRQKEKYSLIGLILGLIGLLLFIAIIIYTQFWMPQIDIC